MSKVKKLFNSLVLSFILVGMLCAGFFLPKNGSIKSQLETFAAGPTYGQIANDLPQYFSSLPNEEVSGYVGKEIFLMQGGSAESASQINATIAANPEHLVSNNNPKPEDPKDQKNYAYMPNVNNKDEYYYFNFQNNLSLYYNLTNEQIASGQVGENLMQGQGISNYASSNGDYAFVPDSLNITPQKLDIVFKLDTLKPDEDMFKNNIVYLNKEGCYTLTVTVNYYYTNNGGVTYTPGSETFNYTFMVFNSNTYFNNSTGLPNISPSSNIQDTSLTSSDTFSRYYFYNYSYAGDNVAPINSLPYFTYNPNLYQITVTFTDLNQTTHESTIVYRDGTFSQLDETGAAISEEDFFLYTTLDGENARITFLDLGYYDMSFQYLYKSTLDGVETIYELPFESSLQGNTTLQNKDQRIFVYGYQAVYSDYSKINEITNQPESVELKTFDLENSIYVKSADITSAFNKYIKDNKDNDIGGKNAPAGSSDGNPAITIDMKSPSYSVNYNLDSLKNWAVDYINGVKLEDGTEINGTLVEPVSTNQTPIKFLTNATLQTGQSESNPTGFSKVYKVSKTDHGYVLDNGTIFDGFNQNEPGTYLYIVQYTYDNYLSETGTLQSSYYHYQAFFFNITNSTPSVTVLDENFNEVYTSGFTNKNVYIINDSQSNEFDADVKITLTARNYATGQYFFQDRDIMGGLEEYGITYRRFEEAEDAEENKLYNEKVAGKYGILIENTNSIANAFFTIKITSANSDKPSTRTFTIDTNEISGINARNVSFSSNTTYRILENIPSYNSNQPLIFSWNEKASGATTYGYVKFIPMTGINYYSSQTNSATLSSLLGHWIENYSTLPVSYKVDLSVNNPWTEYKNSLSFTSTVDATYVKSSDGFYILEIYDQAGNSSFALYMIDSSSPVFVLHTISSEETRKLINNSESISVPENNTQMWIEWANNKAIYLDKYDSYSNLTPYEYGIDVENAQEKLSETLNNFFNIGTGNIKYVSDITIATKGQNEGEISTGISSYNGYYLSVGINNVTYIKDALSSQFTRYQDINSYQLQFINEDNEAIEGTYKFLLRDNANTISYDNEEFNFKNHPSAYLTFNVTSDDSKLTVYRGEAEGEGMPPSLEWASHSITGNLYYYTEDGERIYTHKPSLEDSDIELTESTMTYKFAYYTPVNADEKLTLSFIPLTENGSVLGLVTLKYYPYIKDYIKLDDGNYYYFYDISDESQEIEVYSYSADNNYEAGETLTFDIVLGSSQYPSAGRYVIERQYLDSEDTKVDQYDYFKRYITFDVDDFGLISELESINNKDEETGSSSLESIVGGDILLSMYSGEGNSSIQVSFPKYNNSGLNSGSFYTKDSFTDENEILSVFSVEGNKLPMSLYIPQYKYTINTVYDEATNSYSVVSNNNLSYYGNTTIKQEESDGFWHIYSEGIEISEPVATMAEALEILSETSIVDYEIYAEVQANVTENGRKVTKHYVTNGSTTNGYLNLYEVSSLHGVPAPGATPAEPFYLTGDYVVTLYQAYAGGNQGGFYSVYKFGFKITSSKPEFTIIDVNGYQLGKTDVNSGIQIGNNPNDPYTYYTNSDTLTVQWEVPTSEYQAKIDTSKIVINSYPQPTIPSEITPDNITSNDDNTMQFTLDCSNIIIADGGYVEITMQYEGYNSAYYGAPVTKRIYFDRSAPLGNLQKLMTSTEQATNIFTKNYQELNMRSYYNYKNEAQESVSIDDIPNMSYSYSVNSGYYKYYSYNVTTDFVNKTLVETLNNASNFVYDTQYIYYNYIPAIDSYTQTDKNSLSGSHTPLEPSGTDDLQCGYYEIIEMDYAGNMTVYVIYIIDSMIEDDQNLNDNALSYTNTLHPEENFVKSSDIKEGFNIYSNSGFELKSLSYLSDPWSLIYIKLAGQSSIRYMTSPWLEDGYIYKITISSTSVNFEQVTLLSLFENVESSANKHTLTFTDRINGLSYNTYLSIMDASITTQKVEDPNKTSAILNISIPTQAQHDSTTTTYIFPTKVSIYQFDPNNIDEPWVLQMVAAQEVYGTWVGSPESAWSFISFNIINGGTTLQIVINLGATSAQKVKYEIEDNFGNMTTVIQLANEVSYQEISGNSNVYQLSEGDGSTTYLSDDTIRFSYNTLLYSIEIYDRDSQNVTDYYIPNQQPNNINVYSFSPTNENIYDDYYKIIVYDAENGEEIKTLHIRIYYQLPYLAYNTSEVNNGGIVFVDKNLQPLERLDFAEVPNTTVNFNGTPYTATAQVATTYSQTIRIRFRDGQTLDYQGAFAHQDGYSYSVYLSSDNGTTWQNINSDDSSTSGYTISGTGEYIILIKYDSTDIFTNLCKIFKVNILDSSTSYYYITVDGQPVERSDMKYSDRNGTEYEVNYIVSVDYEDRSNRINIVSNEDLGVIITGPTVEQTGTNVFVEIYHYECSESRGDFTIIYIAETDNIVSEFTYETTSGTTNSIKAQSSVVIVANKETESSFDKLKLNFTSYYGIEQNKINIEVLKLFNGQYSKINPTVYKNGNMSYIYLERSGSYRVKLYDSCTPANVQSFRNNDYIDIVFLNSVPFEITYIDTITGEEVKSEKINNAVYNGDVILSLYNLSSYYQASGYPTISVKLNGRNYTGFTGRNYQYTFSQPGYYSVIFSATSSTGIPIREEEFNFTIVNENESRYAYEFVQYKNYYIESVIKDGIDITQDLIEIGNFSTIRINGTTYLSELLINYLDEKTGRGKYQITINTYDSTYTENGVNSFTFEFWLNMQTPPLSISLAEGDKTTKTITITFNIENFYNAMGDCYIKIGSTYFYFTADELENLGTNYTITIEETGTFFIQVYTMSNNLLYSYKVIKTEPLNTFAIIAIVLGVIAVGAIIGITIALRKRQKVK